MALHLKCDCWFSWQLAVHSFQFQSTLFITMKKILVLLITVSITSYSIAQTAKTNVSTLAWSKDTSHDFGKILQNQPASFTFEFTNNGTVPVTITKAQPSCSCTVPEYTKEPILPGKKGLIKTTYNAHSAGMFNKTVTVSTEPGNETTILKITGEVVQKPADVSKPEAAPKQ